MKGRSEVTFEGTESGDSECFCWEVDEETFREIVGEESYQNELDTRADISGLENEPWRIYPGEVTGRVGYGNQPKKKFTIIVEDL